MNFKERAHIVAKHFKQKDINMVESLTIMHEIINELIDLGVPIKLNEFSTSFSNPTYSEKQKIAKNKRMVRSAIAGKRNLYIRTERKIVNNKKELYGSRKKHQS